MLLFPFNIFQVQPSTDPWKYALVVGGYTSSYEIISNVEVLSLELTNSSVPECMRYLNEFPATLALASGGLSPGIDLLKLQ